MKKLLLSASIIASVANFDVNARAFIFDPATSEMHLGVYADTVHDTVKELRDLVKKNDLKAIKTDGDSLLAKMLNVENVKKAFGDQQDAALQVAILAALKEDAKLIQAAKDYAEVVAKEAKAAKKAEAEKAEAEKKRVADLNKQILDLNTSLATAKTEQEKAQKEFDDAPADKKTDAQEKLDTAKATVASLETQIATKNKELTPLKAEGQTPVAPAVTNTETTTTGTTTTGAAEGQAPVAPEAVEEGEEEEDDDDGIQAGAPNAEAVAEPAADAVEDQAGAGAPEGQGQQPGHGLGPNAAADAHRAAEMLDRV